MDLLPAIDLRDGKVVRLFQGDYDRQTTYDAAPAEMARTILQAGALWVHVVDLDAARSGKVTNLAAIREILQAGLGRLRVEVGGGIRSREVIDMYLEAGVSRLVIGSAALRDWSWFENLLDDPDLDSAALALGLDARAGQVAAQGWTQQLETTALELARRVSGSGLGAIVYTDIARDGMLAGVSLESTRQIVESTDVGVIASGGVAGIEDIENCLEIGCAGVIVGKALYEGKIDLKQAIGLARTGQVDA